MARLIVMRVDLGTGRYKPGDVVEVFENGVDPGTRWRDYFYIVDMPDLSVADAKVYTEVDAVSPELYVRKRKWTLNVNSLERRDDPTRPNLHTDFRIERRFSEVSSAFSLKLPL